jgi:D-psicose/D-tagatose/L-ribulose 3-epimerase
MKIGMNMLLWTNHVSEQHYRIINDLKKTGYDGIEIPIGEGNISQYTSLGNHLASMNMGVTAVTSLLEHTNIANPNASIRQAGLDHLKWAIDMAHAARVEVIGGPFHSAFAYFTRKPPTEDEMKWSIENLQVAGEYAQQASIILTPEVLNRFECYLVNTMADMSVLLDRVDHSYIRAMYDTHHAHIEEKSQSEAILTIASRLNHVHISENDRGTPGKGQVAWDEVFHTLKSINYNRWITIEAFSTAIPEFANSINVWRNFSPVKEIYMQGFEFVKKHWEEA